MCEPIQDSATALEEARQSATDGVGREARQESKVTAAGRLDMAAASYVSRVRRVRASEQGFGHDMHAGQALEVCVHGVEIGLRLAGRGVDQTIGHGQLVAQAELSGQQCERSVDGDRATLLHHGKTGDAVVLVTLSGDALEHFIQCDDRHDQRRWLLDDRGKLIGRRAVCEVLQPSRGIDHVKFHKRSVSRGTVVSIPRRRPRSARALCRGTSSMRDPKGTTSSFCPGRRPSCSRTRLGITT
ncbi:hypothetical protein THICB1_110085 [Thiomonas arsenitoxydans]|uniref:Uncharacterized protein n=1 Tax=Thiomonas arsenitoxydans (strain DSM 22701 / CIP 110005 / 3As) TaxID=426114 RepID=A0ABM9T185_THIA3|nr:hypothetical protein THICB1_110085 [Thiomonas arsenitoxydans]CQR29626.1 hypothetical protein THICB6_150153 [Thiomonas arsenitoxydans]